MITTVTLEGLLTTNHILIPVILAPGINRATKQILIIITEKVSTTQIAARVGIIKI